MSPTQDEPTLQEMSRRLAEVEQANARLHEELGALRAEHLAAREQQVPFSPDALGVFSSSVSGTPAVNATGTNGADGVDAISDIGIAVRGESTSGVGVVGSLGVFPSSFSRAGVLGVSSNNDGVRGESDTENGVSGLSVTGVAGLFQSGLVGLHAVGGGTTTDEPPGAAAIFAQGNLNGIIVQAGIDGYGIDSSGGNIGVYAHNLIAQGNAVYLGTTGLAGDFYGEVFFHNKITKLGGGFQIDHPLDPAKKYLSHSFVESPDMKNIYDGIVLLDTQGEAEVELPDWFEALNTDFRYQLTCIGGYAPVYIAQEIHDHCFTIAGGKAGMKISWQVAGTRQDAWANAHRVQVEIDKPIEEQGHYLAPELHGESEEKSIRWARYPRQKESRLPRIRVGEGSDILPSYESEGGSSPPQDERGDS